MRLARAWGAPEENAGLRGGAGRQCPHGSACLGVAAGKKAGEGRRLGGREFEYELFGHGGERSERRRRNQTACGTAAGAVLESGKIGHASHFTASRTPPSIGPVRPASAPGVNRPCANNDIDPVPPSALSYRDAGVDIDAGDALVERIKPFAERTMRPEVLAGIGGFGALVELPKRYREPVLVSAPTASAPS